MKEQELSLPTQPGAATAPLKTLRWPKVARVIDCMNCGGRGYLAVLSYDGMKRPITCKGCSGSGKQEVR